MPTPMRGISSVARLSCRLVKLTSDIYASLANAASKATDDGAKSVRRTNASASGAPQSRSMPESSHSIESGPW